MKTRLKLFPTMLALIFFLSVFSFGVAADVKYDAHDVEKLRAFLEETDAQGVTNGSKLSASYDPDDPSTWTGEGDGFSQYKYGVNWNEDGRAVAFYCDGYTNGVIYGDFDVEGCDALEYVNIYGAAVESVNFAGCTSLSELIMYYPEVPLERIDLSDNTALTKIVLNDNALTELDLSGNPNLTQLLVEGNNLTELDISSNMKLTLIMCERNSIKEIDLAGHSELIELHCNYNELNSLNTSECPQLYNLQFNYNKIKSIDLSQNLEIAAVGCAGNGMKELSVSGLAELWMIECQENELISLDLRDTCIQDLYCNDNMLEEILVPENSNVQYLYCQNNRLSSLNLENMPNLSVFNGDGNLFEELLISGGITDFSCVGNPMKHLELRHDSGRFELFAQGKGAIGAYYDYDVLKYTARAEAGDGETFFGWYDESGNLVSEEADYALDSEDCTLYARFSVSGEPTPTPPVVDPTEAPIEPTQAPVEPTEAPVDPTQAPVDPDPDDPTPPATGAISLICIGLAAAAGGASAMLFRKKGKR